MEGKKWNRDYLDSLLIETRYIDAKKPDTSFLLYGEHFKTPVMVAALSCSGEMMELEKGAVMAGAVSWAEMEEKEESVKINAAGAKTIKIIKPYADNNLIFNKINEAEKCGALAVCIDIEHAFDDKGDSDSVQGCRMAPKSMEEIREFADATSLPFIIKGVLGTQDTYKAMKAGAKGLVVSHHGNMDCAVPPLMILPEILKVVNGQIPVFVDCEIISGADAFKALALGATAVCAGGRLLKPLGGMGAESVAKAVTQINDELKKVMAETGCYDLAHMDKTVIHMPKYL